MSLLERVNGEMTAALKARDGIRLATLRLLKTALVNREVERGRPLEPAEEQQVVSSLVKQRRDSIEQYTRAGRDELAERERAEIPILEAFLPPPVGTAEIEAVVDEVVAATGASSARDLGRVMKAVMERFAGRGVDGKAVNELVRARLGRGGA